MKPTLGRTVHFKLGLDQWVTAHVTKDEGATEDLAHELELMIPFAEAMGLYNVKVIPPPGVVILGHRAYAHNVRRGEGPGCWRWPPREGA